MPSTIVTRDDHDADDGIEIIEIIRHTSNETQLPPNDIAPRGSTVTTYGKGYDRKEIRAAFGSIHTEIDLEYSLNTNSEQAHKYLILSTTKQFFFKLFIPFKLVTQLPPASSISWRDVRITLFPNETNPRELQLFFYDELNQTVPMVSLQGIKLPTSYIDALVAANGENSFALSRTRIKAIVASFFKENQKPLISYAVDNKTNSIRVIDLKSDIFGRLIYQKLFLNFTGIRFNKITANAARGISPRLTLGSHGCYVWTQPPPLTLKIENSSCFSLHIFYNFW